MDFTEHNINKLVDYFKGACTQEQKLGLELEHFVISSETHESLPYENGVEEILNELQPAYGDSILSQNRIVGIDRKGTTITLEPAAQLELSIEACKSIQEIAEIYKLFEEMIFPILKKRNCELACLGYQPKSQIDNLALIPKSRYGFMDMHFKSTGTKGKNMMRGTASTQVSIDYEDEEDFKKKFRVANILGPLFSFICDNTTTFEGEAYEGQMLRTVIWNDVDPERSMVVAGSLDEPFGFYEYAKYIYDSPPIILTENENTIYTGFKTNSELFLSTPLSQDDIAHITSMVFPDVRLKQYIEIRMADSLPIDEALSYVAFIKGLLYNKPNLELLHELTIGIKNIDVAEAKNKLILEGNNSTIYEKPCKQWIAELFSLAESGTVGSEKFFLKPLQEKQNV